MMPNPYDKTTHDGNTVDWLTKAALLTAEKMLGYELTITQGSYNAGGVVASAGTHDGGGVVDLAAWDWANKVRTLRKIGFAAWHRTPSQGPWPEHIHAVLIGNEKLSSGARAQVTAYLNGRNGLANNAPDDGPRDFVNARFTWDEWLKSQAEPKRRLTLATFNLLRGRPASAVKDEVQRLWDAASLDALAVQEAEGYFQMLNHLPGADYFADPENPENGILVAKGRGSNFFTHEVGDGWVREGGAKRGPGEFPRVTIDGWCRVGSTHWPPSTNWRNGQLVAPPERVDDVREWAEACKRFLERDKGTSVLLGDNNEAAATRGQWSPGWVAEQAGAKVGTSAARKIDWGMVVNGSFENVRTSPIAERSDHEPEVMDVVEA